MIWKDVRWLMSMEIKHNSISVVSTIGTTIILAFFMSTLFSFSVFKSETQLSSLFLLDYLFLMVNPLLSTIYMSRPYLTFRNINLYSEKMALYRVLPISLQALSWSKTGYMLLTLLVQSCIFYGIFTWNLSNSINFHIYLHPIQWLLFTLFWFGYALALGSIYLLFEHGAHGKVMHATAYAFIGLVLIIEAIYHFFIKKSLVVWSVDLIKNYGGYLPLVSIGCGVILMYVCNRLLTHRLQNRDYV